MSLQTGTQLAQAKRPIVDPGNLKVVAYEVEGPLLAEKPSYLRTDDIRELGSVGMIVDSSDEFVGPDDIIKLKELDQLGFNLIGMVVIDEVRRKLGKIEDFTIDTGSFIVQQLTVKRGFIRGITDTSLLIHRTQIVEINDQHIIVKAAAKKIQPVEKAIRHDYVNPFRSANTPVESQEN